jgi:acetyl coenzyme A synthetase (ADP forming)-like protein
MLDTLFSPRSVAVIGASRDEAKVGHVTLRNIKRAGFAGAVYPVNPKSDEILGFKCYPDIASIPEQVDLVVFVVPPKVVLSLIDEASAKGAASAIIITAGFKETGPEGAKLERELKAKIDANGMRVLGPNCLGLIDTASKLNASFAPGMPAPGKIGFFSQSGALCTAILDWALAEKVGFSKFVSLGNKTDIDEVSMLSVLGDDDGTDVILGYIEGVKDGQKFMEVSREVSRKKPIVIVKSGGTEAGARAASSHTGTLAGSENAFNAAFHQSGIIRAKTIEELFDFALAFAYQPVPAGNRLAIVTNAGGPGIIAADAAERTNVRLAGFEKNTIDTLRANLPSTAAVYNPVDVIGDAAADRYKVALDAVAADPGVDGVLVLLTPQDMTEPVDTARLVASTSNGEKPILTSFMGGLKISEAVNFLREEKVPNFPYPERAVAAFDAMCSYSEQRKMPERKLERFDVDKETVERVLADALSEGRLSLGEQDARQVIQAYGFRVPGSLLARTVYDAKFAAEKMGYPVVMKIVSPDILHKSDIGGVKVGLADSEEVWQSFHDMTTRAKRLMPEAQVWGVSIQEMVAGGKEVILGMMRDPQFGPLLMFGLGGIYVEVLKDVTFRVGPVDRREAVEMIRGIKSYGLLRGARGEKPVDIDAIVDSVLRLSQLVTDFPQIVELDINPLSVFPKGREPVAVDARLTITGGDKS